MRDTSIWPLFGLQIGVADLTLRAPDDDDVATLIALAKSGIHDPSEMPFAIPWTDAPSPAFERNFVQYYWKVRADWRPEDWSLPMMVSIGGEVVGVQDLRAVDFATMRSVDTGSWLASRYQRRGIGSRMREAALAFAFDHLGARLAHSAAFEDNESSRRVSEKLGYAENGWRLHLRRDAPVRQIRYVMDLDAWRARERPRVVVEGLDPCRELFGVAP